MVEQSFIDKLLSEGTEILPISDITYVGYGLADSYTNEIAFTFDVYHHITCEESISDGYREVIMKDEGAHRKNASRIRWTSVCIP